jgi:site-specific recombinase XerD
VSKSLKKAVRASGLSEDYHWHCLRSTAASNWVNRKVPIYTVQKLLGHAKTSTTSQYYAKVNIDELRDAVNKL